MFVAVDDTDSMKGNCTTFLATEIIHEFIKDMDLIGNPRLVRLNPATPWKTRGNGSLVMRFGKGKGGRRLIGNLYGEDLYCYDDCTDEEPDPIMMRDRIIPLIERYHEDEADPGLLISSERPGYRFYTLGVTTILDRKIIDEEIGRMGAVTFTIGNGRGLIGCLCGMAWVPGDSTFELLSYRPQARWGTERVFDPLTIRDVEHGYPSTFNSWEDRTSKVAMVPSTPCPVMYGLRGDSEEDLIIASKTIKTEPLDRWVVFLTNQGTDDHILREYDELVPNRSYSIVGTVSGLSYHITGGHVFIDIVTDYGPVTCAAYEPSKEFRYVLDWLRPGDEVEVLGELREEPRTLNLEKIHVLYVADEYRKLSNPICPNCGTTMKSKGRNQLFRCKKCGTRSDAPIMEKVERCMVPGWFEPPTAARRHLSKPLKRMGVETSVDFVNGRT